MNEDAFLKMVICNFIPNLKNINIMDTLQQLESELEQEYKTTKKFFELYPEDKPDYAPHVKSMKMKDLAGHIAEVFAWPVVIMNTPGIDFAKGDYVPTVVNSKKELLEILDKNYQAGMEALKKAKEADLEPSWHFANDGHILAEWSKYGAIRQSLNQVTHHRAQLGVFYRLLDIPLPGSYGPTADSQSF